MNFLPKDFDTQQSIVLLAGKGMYPQLVWERLSKTCPNASLFCFEEEVKSWAEQAAQGRYSFFSIGQVGTWLKALKKCSARYVLLAGQITPKKLFQGLNPDLKAILLLASLKEKNASTIFGALIKEIEKALIKAEIGITPNSDGMVIRLAFPPLTQDRRKELAKEVRAMGEDAKVAIRNVRRDATDAVKKLEKSENLPEDAIKDGQDQVQKITDKFVKIVDETVSAKEKEVMEI